MSRLPQAWAFQEMGLRDVPGRVLPGQGGASPLQRELKDGLPTALHLMIQASLSQGFLSCPEPSLGPPWDLAVNLGLLEKKDKIQPHLRGTRRVDMYLCDQYSSSKNLFPLFFSFPFAKLSLPAASISTKPIRQDGLFLPSNASAGFAIVQIAPTPHPAFNPEGLSEGL